MKALTKKQKLITSIVGAVVAVALVAINSAVIKTKSKKKRGDSDE